MSKDNEITKVEIIQENYEKILEVANSSRSLLEVLKVLGYNKNWYQQNNLKFLLNKNGFSYETFKINKEKLQMNTSIFNNKEKLLKIVPHCNSYTEIIRNFTDVIAAGHYIGLKKYLKIFEISVEHFDIKKLSKVGKLSNQEIFKENSKVCSSIVKNRIIKNKLLNYKCSVKECGNKGSWLGKKLVLQLEHINGINNDHRLSNLTWLCPNCHSMTDTFCSRNKKKLKVLKGEPLINKSSLIKKIEKDKEEFFIILKSCKSYKDVFNKYGFKGSKKMSSDLFCFLNENVKNTNVSYFLKNLGVREVKIPYPPMEKLLKMLKEKPFTKIAIELGCSDNAIRKHLKRNGVNFKNKKL